jgi:UDP-glucose 4-epimerase
MRILVTGGAGFIGSHVADAYLAAGHQVVILDDLSTGKRENLNPAAELWELDVAGAEAAEAVAGGGFAVVNHHAAQVSVPYSVEHPLEDLRINGRGTLNLLAAAAAGGARRFIFISSGGAVYGEQESLPTAEETPPRPLSPYAVHKLLGESYLPHFRAERGLETVVLRYANVYGPRQSPHAEAGVVAIFCQHLLAGRQPRLYRHDDMPRGMIRDYVYVDDCVAANLAALDRGGGGVFNIGTGAPTATLDLLEELARAAGASAEPAFGPPRPGDLRRSLLDPSLAQRELGWRARVDLARGAALTMEWQRGRGAPA